MSSRLFHLRQLVVAAVVAAATVLVVVGLVLAGAAGPVRAETAAERRLAEARAALERISDELDAAEQEAEGAEADLEEATDRLRRLESVVNEVAAAVEAQRVLVRDAERRLVRIEAELTTLEEAFTDRVARLFKQGPGLTFETLLNAEGADEAIARTELLGRVLAGDQVDLERLEALTVAVEAQRAFVAAEQAELELQLAEQQELVAEAEELRSSRALAAADAQARAEELAGERDELEADEEELVALVERQQEEERRRQAEERRRQQQASTAPSSGGGGGSSAPAASGGGGYAWPMCAPVTSEYGPRWGRMHRGIDLGAPVGTPIRAIRSGTVIFAGWQGGYGRMTLIDHGNGVVSAYAHQSRFAVGQGSAVSQGQVIGYVGMTGNTTGPHLHLETRVGGSAVNPRQYLSGSPC